MRSAYVLLGLVALTSIQISSGECSNGLVGVQKDDICCDADCGTCGGIGCGQQPGGKPSCCTGRIRDSGVMCSTASAAPCIIDDEERVCSNGLPGVQEKFFCCEAQCGVCGGLDCSQRPGGQFGCCMGRIWDSGKMCDATTAAPCIIDEEVPDEVCSNGVPGVQRGDSCCEAQCGTCGGSDCRKRPGGKLSCCTNQIENSDILCSYTPVAPCIIDDDGSLPTST